MAARTWQDASQEILDRLDLAAEYHALGVETFGQPSATGWLSCKVYGSDESNPSAGICIAGDHPTKGRYKEHTGDGRNLAFWDFCVVAGRFTTWQAAREHYRERTGVEPAANAPRDPDSQLHFREWNKSLVNTWCLKKPPITQEAVFLAGGCLAEWPAKSRHHVVIALPVYGWPLRVEAPTGWVVWNKSGRDLPLWQGKDKPPRPVKMLSVSGTRSGLMGRHGLETLPAAELVWKVEGPSDMLALMSVMPAELRDKHAVVANSGGAMETPRPEIVAAFEGKRVAVAGDADSPGQAGARRWAEAIAAVAEEVRCVTLPYPIEESHGKDLRDWFAEGHDYDELLSLYRAFAVVPKPPPGPAPSPNGHATTPPYTAIPPGTTVLAGDRGNFGTVVSDEGDSCVVRFVSPSGQEAVKTLPKAQLRLQNGQPLTGPGPPSGRTTSPPPVPLRQIVADYPNLRRPVIDKLLRQGETMNVIASPKAGKSWLAAGLAMAVAAGWEWLDLFKCHVGRVLVIDAELHPENIAHRYPWIASELQMPDEYADRIDVWALRGKGENLFTLANKLWQIEPGYYSLVLLDAWYRFLPPGVSENDNAAVMSLYNAVDSYADRLQSAWVNIHHASKGDQSDKGTTDVGSGAGSQSRAADCHLIVRPHEEDDKAVVDAVVRSFPPVESFVIRWELPLWWPDGHADPRKLRRGDFGRKAQQEARDAEGFAAVLNALAKHGPGTNRDLRGWTGLSRERLQRLLDQLQAKDQIAEVATEKSGNRCRKYELTPALDSEKW